MPGSAELVCVLIVDPDAPGRLEEWRACSQARGLLAVLGPTVPSAPTDHSCRRARMRSGARAPGLLTRGGPGASLGASARARCCSPMRRSHRTSRSRNLEPLDELTPAARARGRANAPRLASPPGQRARGRRRAGCSPADRPLPARASARAVRRGAR